MSKEKVIPAAFLREKKVCLNGSGGSGKSAIIEPKIRRSETPDDWRFSTRGTAARIFLTCWFVFSAHFATNTVREIFPALSLGDHSSFDVSEYAGLHPDIFTLENRGAFINNNPGASILGAIPYLIFRPLTDALIARTQAARAAHPEAETANYDSVYPMAREFYQKSRQKGFDIKFGLAAAEMQFFVMSPLTALSVVVMFYFFLNRTENAKIAVLLALLYAFATPIFFRAGQLNQNLLVADFSLFSFALLNRFGAAEKKPFYLLAGLCAGWTIVLDYSGAVAVAVLSFYALARWVDAPKDERDAADLIKFSGGVLACCLILFASQWACFGSPLLPAQSYMPPANFTDSGYRGLALPQLDLLWATAFSSRYGLFTSAPILLTAFAFPWRFRKKNRLMARRDLIFCGFFIGLFFLFCAANQYGRMQFNTGVRHIIPVVPFVFFFAAGVLLKLPKLPAAVIGIVGIYWSWCLAMYRDVELGAGVFEAVKNISFGGFRLPWLSVLQKMNFVENSSPLPLFALGAALLFALWTIGAKTRETNFLINEQI